MTQHDESLPNDESLGISTTPPSTESGLPVSSKDIKVALYAVVGSLGSAAADLVRAKDSTPTMSLEHTIHMALCSVLAATRQLTYLLDTFERFSQPQANGESCSGSCGKRLTARPSTKGLWEWVND